MAKTTSNNTKNKYGWRGKILQVDLTSAKVWDEELSEDLIRGYIGGLASTPDCCMIYCEMTSAGSPFTRKPPYFRSWAGGGDFISLCFPFYHYFQESLNRDLRRL